MDGMDWVLILLEVVLLMVGYALYQKNKALRESESMWRHFVDIADVGIFIHRDDRLLFANHYLLQRMGLELSEAVGTRVMSYVHQDYQERVAERLRDVMVHRRVVQGVVTRYVAPGGREFDVEESSVRIQFEGEPAILGVARDITERMRYEKALKASEAQYRQLVERSPDAVAIHQHGVWCFINPAGVQLFAAKDASELLGQPVLDRVHPDDRPKVLVRMRQALEEGKEVELTEERLLTLDGRVIWGEVTAIPIEWDGCPASLVIARGITARKEAEEKLRQEKRKLKVVLEHAPVGIWMTDMQHRVQLVNRAFSDAVGVSEEAFRAAKTFSDVLPQAISESCMRSDEVCMARQTVVHMQESIPCVDGKSRVFDVIKAPIWDDDGKMVGIIGSAIDATERLEAEAEKERMQRQLEHTQRLESLGVLAGGIAHDFNNILATVMGNASLLSKKIPEGSGLERNLQYITEASEKAALLCRQMLAYSGQGQFSIRAVNLTDMTRSIASLLEVSLAPRVQLHYALDEALPNVDADEAQMQQVIMNLVMNASEAMGEQGGHIHLRTCVRQILPKDLQEAVESTELKLTEPYVCLQVKDDGCGMDDEVQKHIFDPFFTTKFTGRGLGMSAMLGIVKAHHGCLSLWSEPGVGSDFRIFFPISSKEVEKVAEVEEAEQQTGGVILLVDDDAMIRETVSMMLEDFGYQVQTAEDGESGIEAYQVSQQDVALVILDMTMPGMNGVECLQVLKEINPMVKVVLSSGYQESEVLQGVSGGAVDGFIQKPYRPDVLESLLLRVLGS